jgi:hypothetical protein
MTKPHLGIASYEEMKARTLAIASGELKPKPDDLQVTIDLVQDKALTGALPRTPGYFGPDDE